jgi:hypothetical protein
VKHVQVGNAISNDYIEPDAFWFAPDFALDHPDFPWASSIALEMNAPSKAAA